MTKERWPALSTDQRAALEAFGEGNAHGSAAWRESLCLTWASGADSDRPALRQLRNHYGPSWVLDVYAWGWMPEPGPWAPIDRHDGKAESPVARWSGGESLPGVGDRVGTSNGPGVVTGYFVQGGYLGLTVRTDAPKNGHPVGHYFGAELRQLDALPALSAKPADPILTRRVTVTTATDELSGFVDPVADLESEFQFLDADNGERMTIKGWLAETNPEDSE